MYIEPFVCSETFGC